MKRMMKGLYNWSRRVTFTRIQDKFEFPQRLHDLVKRNKFPGLFNSSMIIYSSFAPENKISLFEYNPHKEDYSRLLISQKIPILRNNVKMLIVCVIFFSLGLGSAYIYNYSTELKINVNIVNFNKKVVEYLQKANNQIHQINLYHLKFGYLYWKISQNIMLKRKNKYNKEEAILDEDMFIK